MVSEKITLHNPSGLHLRPASILCKEATKYRSVITISTHNGARANAKSILNILASSIKTGDTIELSCEGQDEVEAMAKLKKLIEDGLGEI